MLRCKKKSNSPESSPHFVQAVESQLLCHVLAHVSLEPEVTRNSRKKDHDLLAILGSWERRLAIILFAALVTSGSISRAVALRIPTISKSTAIICRLKYVT
jgi:hypothetical protein